MLVTLAPYPSLSMRFDAMATNSVSAAEMAFRLEQDRAAAAGIRQARDRNGRLHYSMGDAALFELAGHPGVFDETGTAMEVVEVERVLVVDEHEGGLRACLVPGDEDTEDCCVRLADDGRRCEATRFTPGQRPSHRRWQCRRSSATIESPNLAGGVRGVHRRVRRLRQATHGSGQ